MENAERNRHKYRKIMSTFDELAGGKIPEDLASSVDRAYLLFHDGFQPTEFPESDYARNTLTDIKKYCDLLRARRKVDMAGGMREITTEEDALNSLILAENLAKGLLVPLFKKRTAFSDVVFRDIHHLSLSYVDAIVNGVADEYVAVDEAFDAKQRAVALARQGMRVFDTYDYRGFNDREDVRVALKKFEEPLARAQRTFMRGFENVPTTPKKVHKAKQLTRKLIGEMTEQDEKGDFLFEPGVIFPIAHGGTEFGVRTANAYEDQGHDIVVYPLLYSIKTRRHRYPWVQHDVNFLGRSLEGQNVLLTEDWVTTGNTLRGILNQIERAFPREIRVATIKRDPEKSQVPILDKYRFYIGEFSNYGGNKTDSLSDMDKH